MSIKQALFIFFSLAVAASSANIYITSPRITNWGTWGNFQRCPNGRYAQGFQLNTEPHQWSGDDTALNAIRLFCGDPARPNTAVITSSEGPFGKWGKIFSCYPGFLNAFQMRVEETQGTGDDTATNNIQFNCSNTPSYVEGDGLSFGSWGPERRCLRNQAICGIQTQVEISQGSGDDTTLNNVRMECCDFGRSLHDATETQTQ